MTPRSVSTIFMAALLTARPPIAQGAAQEVAPGASPDEGLSAQVAELRALVLKLQSRVDELEARTGPAPAIRTMVAEPRESTATPQPVSAKQAPTPEVLSGTTINFLFDGYYGYNFNAPVGRDNLLRAYDVSSNNFTVSQAAAVLEHAPDPANGRRFGARLDLQFGQATQSLQGNPANEPRPEIYRNIFQAYGTYVFPVGKGLSMDFGKWASSLGLEGTYAKDQMNYSRGFLFGMLPFYHTGVRLNYNVTNRLAVNYWAVNGTQQTEAFNNFKDQFIGFTMTPATTVNWNVNYYLGQEHPDTIYYQRGDRPGVQPALPNLQGTAFSTIANAPRGKLHILDSYVTWQARPKLKFALEGDCVINRLETNSRPDHDLGGAVYARYQFTPKFALAGRGEYLSDRGGLFSGSTQALKETTLTAEYKFGEGFLARGEFRRDSSNQPYFLTGVLGKLKKEQNTATLGLIWWFGQKTGSW